MDMIVLPVGSTGQRVRDDLFVPTTGLDRAAADDDDLVAVDAELGAARFGPLAQRRCDLVFLIGRDDHGAVEPLVALESDLAEVRSEGQSTGNLCGLAVLDGDVGDQAAVRHDEPRRIAAIVLAAEMMVLLRKIPFVEPSRGAALRSRVTDIERTQAVEDRLAPVH